jgi:hypothetical protein
LLSTLIIVFQSQAQEFDLHLRWQANGEPDLAGYRIYWRTGSSGDVKEDYDGIHPQSSQYNSPIDLDLLDLDDAENPTFVLPDMDESEVYFLRLTAYDNENPSLESELSEEYATIRIESIMTTSSDGDYGVGDQIGIRINLSEPATLENGNMLVVFNSGSAIVISPFDELSSIDADYIERISGTYIIL